MTEPPEDPTARRATLLRRLLLLDQRTQQQLAAQIGCTQSQISNLARGKEHGSIATWTKIAESFGFALWEFERYAAERTLPLGDLDDQTVISLDELQRLRHAEADLAAREEDDQRVLDEEARYQDQYEDWKLQHNE